MKPRMISSSRENFRFASARGLGSTRASWALLSPVLVADVSEAKLQLLEGLSTSGSLIVKMQYFGY